MFDKVQIEKSLREKLKSEGCDFDNIDVYTREYKGHDAVFVTISNMYEKPTLEKGGLLAFLIMIRDAIGVKDLDLYDEISRGGCETCDYGSKYGWEFVGWNE